MKAETRNDLREMARSLLDLAAVLAALVAYGIAFWMIVTAMSLDSGVTTQAGAGLGYLYAGKIMMDSISRRLDK